MLSNVTTYVQIKESTYIYAYRKDKIKNVIKKKDKNLIQLHSISHHLT